MEVKKAKVIMLPTNKNPKKGIYLYTKEERKLELHYLNQSLYKEEPKHQHLYITTDDEIKEGDYAYDTQTKSIYRVGIFTSKAGHESHSIKPLKSNVEEGKFYTYVGMRYSQYNKKIIATTDKSLNNELIQGGKLRINYHLPQPSQAFIEKYCEKGSIDEVLVEYDCISSTRLEIMDFSKEPVKIISSPESECFETKLKVDSHNTITIHPIKDSWNREEVEILLKKYAFEEHIISNDSLKINNWIKENL